MTVSTPAMHHHPSPSHGDRAVPLADVSLTINGKAHRLRIEPCVTLLDLLRDHLHLTGTKKGCDHGQCGACTVLRDGKRINACLTLAVMQRDAQITTVEGLAGEAAPASTVPASTTGQGPSDDMHPLQAAFIAHDAFQCGYCTPGQLCSAAGLLNEEAPANACELRERLSGNLCRCGAYPQIAEAVTQVLHRHRPAVPPAAAPRCDEPAVPA